MKISPTKAKRIRSLFQKAWLLSEGSCPESDKTYWAGFAHALGFVAGNYQGNIYAIRILEESL